MSFFSPSRRYFVVGASSDPSKFGYKVLEWYTSHGLPVTPVNPKSDSIMGVKTVPSLLDATNEPGEFSVSFITPPRVTQSIIDELLENKGLVGEKFKGFWFQPGSFDNEAVKSSKKLGVPCVIDDDCILVSGERRWNSELSSL